MARFLSDSSIDVATPNCLPLLYTTVLKDPLGPFPRLRPEKSRNVHTSEQKLWSLGQLIDAVLYPFWADNAHFDLLMQNPAYLAGDEEHQGFKLFRQALVFTHTFEYLFLALGPKDVVTVRESDCQVKSGKNGQAFLDIANSVGERTEPNQYGWSDIVRHMRPLLPENSAMDYDVFEAQANACKVIQCFQTLFSALMLGKERNADLAVEGRRLKKSKKPQRGRAPAKKPAASLKRATCIHKFVAVQRSVLKTTMIASVRPYAYT